MVMPIVEIKETEHIKYLHSFIDTVFSYLGALKTC